MMRVRIAALLLSVGALLGQTTAPAAVQIIEDKTELRVTIGGHPFTTYRFAPTPDDPKWNRPYFYPVCAADGVEVTSDQQREILKESKESCDRLVRVVSMFLNYSALESGKLVLQLHENDLRDCISDMAGRWQDAFQRANVRLDIQVHDALPPFRFDYQKVQQCMVNLLDNALKHTPQGGSVTLRAQPHFWERRLSEASPSEERRRGSGEDGYLVTGNAVDLRDALQV